MALSGQPAALRVKKPLRGAAGLLAQCDGSGSSTCNNSHAADLHTAGFPLRHAATCMQNCNLQPAQGSDTVKQQVWQSRVFVAAVKQQPGCGWALPLAGSLML